MTIALIIIGIIAWCIVGYFVNINLKKMLLNHQCGLFDVDTVLICIYCSFMFPITLMSTILYFINEYIRTFTIFQKLADWHNGVKK